MVSKSIETFGQTAEKNVISTAGNWSSSTGYSTGWTIGESETGVSGNNNELVFYLGYNHLPYNSPRLQAKNIQLNYAGYDTLSFSWERGNGNACAVFMNVNPLPIYDYPKLNKIYTADTVFIKGTQIGTSGWYCVYNGTDTVVTVTGLESGWPYKIMVSEYNQYFNLRLYNNDTMYHNPFTLFTKENPHLKPSIIQQSDSTQMACESDSVRLFVYANGTHPIHYQWIFNKVEMTGEKDSILDLTKLSTGNSGIYQCTIWNEYDTTITDSINLTVNNIPSKPNIPDTSICQNQAVQKISANVTGILKWFDRNDNLIYIGDTLSLNISNPDTFSYYVDQTINGCTSDKEDFSVTIKEKPQNVTPFDTLICFGQQNPEFKINGNDSVFWYNDSLKATIIDTTDTFQPIKDSAGFYQWYVIRRNNGCESNLSRMSLTIHDLPVIDSIEYTDETSCDAGDGTITISASDNGILKYSLDSVLFNNTTGYFQELAKGFYYPSVINEHGCKTTSDTTIEIISPEIHGTPGLTGDTAYCQNEDSVILLATAKSGGILYWFDESGDTINNGDTLIKLSTDHIGTFQYAVKERKDKCFSNPNSILINVYPIPVPPETSDDSVCFGETIQELKATGSDLKWYKDTLVANTNHFVPKITDVGLYTFCVTQTIKNCESSCDSLFFIIKPKPHAAINLEENILCKGESTILVATGGENYNWSNDLQNDTINISPETDSTFTVTVSENGCDSVVSANIKVNNPPSEVTCAGSNYCIGETGGTVVLDNSENGIKYYLFRNGMLNDSIPGSGNNLNWVDKLAGTYTVHALDTGTGCEISMKDTVIVIQNPLPTVDAGTDAKIEYDQKTTIGNSQSQSGFTYFWSPGLLLEENDVSNPTTTSLTKSTTYYLTVTDLNKCSNTDSVKVVVGLWLQINAIDTSVCKGDSVKLKATIKGGSEKYNCIWYDGTEIISNDTALSSNPDNSTSYKLKVIDRQDKFNSDSMVQQITVIPRPASPDNIDTSFCQNTEGVQLCIDGDSIKWYKDTTFNPLYITNCLDNIVTSNPGIFRYHIRQTGLNGCESYAGQLNYKIDPTIDITIEASTTEVDYQQSALLTAKGAEQYSWRDESNILVSTKPQYNTPKLTENSIYKVTGISGACSDSDSIMIAVKCPVSSVHKILTDKSGTFDDGCPGMNYANNTLSEWLIIPPGVRYIYLCFEEFDLADGDTLKIYDGFDNTGIQRGIYYKGNEPANGHGLALDNVAYLIFTSDEQNTSKGFIIHYSNADTLCNTTNLKKSQIIKDNLTIYPNPARDKVYIQFYNVASERVRMKVYNDLNELISANYITAAPGANKIEFNVHGLLPGLYLVEIVYGNSILHGKMVVE